MSLFGELKRRNVFRVSLQIIPLTMEYSVFTPLRGEPRFEDARTRMLVHLNKERARLGLEPVST